MSPQSFVNWVHSYYAVRDTTWLSADVPTFPLLERTTQSMAIVMFLSDIQ